MIRSKHHPKPPMSHTIRIRITRRRWTPEDIEAGEAEDPGEAWDELFETEEEADAYLWDRFGQILADLRAMRDAWSGDCKPAGTQSPYGAHAYYSDQGDSLETIENGGTIEWTATIIRD